MNEVPTFSWDDWMFSMLMLSPVTFLMASLESKCSKTKLAVGVRASSHEWGAELTKEEIADNPSCFVCIVLLSFATFGKM